MQPVVARRTQRAPRRTRRAGREQLAADVRAELDAKALDGVLVVLDLLHLIRHRLGHRGLAEARHALEAAVGHDGHDAGQDGRGDADAAAVGDKLGVALDLVEELRHDEVGARVHLLLQVRDVGPVVGLGVGWCVCVCVCVRNCVC